MFAGPSVALPLRAPPANPVGNRCAQRNRSTQWNAQRTQRGETAKLKMSPCAFLQLSSNWKINTIARTGAASIGVELTAGTTAIGPVDHWEQEQCCEHYVRRLFLGATGGS